MEQQDLQLAQLSDAFLLTEKKMTPNEEAMIPTDFDWTIDRLSRAVRNAGRTAFYSDAFTSLAGHKMCLRWSPVGDMSLDLCFLRGPCDSAVQWPFPYAVQLQLVDQITGALSDSKTMRFCDKARHFGWHRPASLMGAPIEFFTFGAEFLKNVVTYQQDRISIKCTIHHTLP